MKIYIACALTHVPKEKFGSYVSFIHRLAEVLRLRHQVKYALMDSDPQLADRPKPEQARLCYLWDREMVEAADLIIAEATYPSIGLGIEMQIAEGSGKPIIIGFHDFSDLRASGLKYKNPDTTEHELQVGEGFVSLMALGLPTVFSVHRYSDDAQGIRLLNEAVNLLDKNRTSAG